MIEERMSYIGRCRQCHKVYMAVVDEPEHADDVARDVAKVLADGDTIERVTVEWVRENWGDTCDCEALEDPAEPVPGSFYCYAPPAPETVRAVELERLAAWNAGAARKVSQ